MDSENEGYYRVGAAVSQQASSDRATFSKFFPPVSAEIYSRNAGGLNCPRYQDFSSPWTSQFMGDNVDNKDFADWPGAFADGETTDPASDDLDGARASGSSSSDEDSERLAAPWAVGAESWKTPAVDVRGSGKLQSMLSRVPLPHQGLSEDAPRKGLPREKVFFTAPLPEDPASRLELPTEGLIDVDPEEGRKRGDELMSMLFMPQEDFADTSPLPTLSADALPFSPPKPAAAAQPQPKKPQSQESWATEWAGSGTSGWSSYSSKPASATVSESARHPSAVQQAAQDAFGPLLKEVVVANDGYLVLLHDSFKQYDDVPVLAILGRALWPLLGREVTALEPCLGPAGQHRLALKMQDDSSELESKLCWEFATTGACPRGSRCRWEHEAFPTRTTFIDVVY